MEGDPELESSEESNETHMIIENELKVENTLKVPV